MPIENEVGVKLGSQRVQRRTDPSQPNLKHNVMSLSPWEGEAYVIDLAGAQFGMYRVITPFDQYTKSLVEYFGHHLFGYEAKLHAAKIPKAGGRFTLGYGSEDLRIYSAHADVTQILNQGIDEWEKEAGKTVAGILNQKQEAYERDRDWFLKDIKDAMVDFVDWMKEKPDQGFAPGQAASGDGGGIDMSQFVQSGTGVNPFGEGEYEDGDEYRGDGPVNTEDILAKLRSVGMF